MRPSMLLRACVCVVMAVVVTACGPGEQQSPGPSSKGTAGINVGDVAYSSSLKTPSSEFASASSNVSEAADGMTLTVSQPGSFTYAGPRQSAAIPQSFATRVDVDTARAGALYFGIACSGLDINNTYLLLADRLGNFMIAAVKGGKPSTLKQGTGAPASATETIDAACATPVPGQASLSLRLVLAVDSKIVASVDVPSSSVGVSNSLAIFTYSADTHATGAAVFHDLSVRAAQAA